MIIDASNDLSKKKAIQYFDSLVKNGARFQLKKIKEVRSISQNKYFHVCIALFSAETGYTIEEGKTVLKREYGLFYEKNGKNFLKSTSELDTLEMNDFIEWIRTLSSDTLGVYIPTPEEYISMQFDIEREIENVR